LRKHVIDLLIAQEDLVHRISLSFQGLEIAVDIRGQEDLYFTDGMLAFYTALNRLSGFIPGFQSNP
jgi:hypothetical protein